MKATFDPAKNLDLYFRKGRNGSKTFYFFDSAGDDYDLTDEFEFKSSFDVTLEVTGNEIELTFDEEEAIKRDSCFWELINLTLGKTWLCGTAYFTEGLSAEASDTEDITIIENGEIVNITINESGSGVNNFRGSHNLATGSYPSSGGTGAAGIPAIGDQWYGINFGNFDVEDMGVITLYRGALLIYIGGTVTDPASWIVKQ